MHVVDLEKLALHRDMPDWDIVQLQFEHELSIPKATIRYAKEQLDHILIVRRGWGDSSWSSCLAVPVDVARRVERVYKCDADEDMVKSAKAMADLISERTFVARLPYDAAIAAICKLIEPSCELSLTNQQLEDRYATDESARIAAACPLAVPKSYLDPERFLYESMDEHALRLKTVLAQYYVIQQTEDQFGSGAN